jgi:5-methylthioadenosine/S-adenosylhomocysteine deaminase
MRFGVDRFTKAHQLLIHTNDFSTVVHNLLMETQEDFIHHVMVEGEWVMFNREILTVDEEEINKEYLRILEKVYNKIG